MFFIGCGSSVVSGSPVSHDDADEQEVSCVDDLSCRPLCVVRGMPVEAVAVRQHTATVRVCPFEPIDPLEHHIEALTILKSGAVPLLLFSRNCLLLRILFRFPTVSSSGSKM